MWPSIDGREGLSLLGKEKTAKATKAFSTSSKATKASPPLSAKATKEKKPTRARGRG